jgi:hypothetical protein
MPISTNAPFNEFGQSQILRDIEQLYLALNGAGSGGPGDGQTQDQTAVTSQDSGGVPDLSNLATIPYVDAAIANSAYTPTFYYLHAFGDITPSTGTSDAAYTTQSGNLTVSGNDVVVPKNGIYTVVSRLFLNVSGWTSASGYTAYANITMPYGSTNGSVTMESLIFTVSGVSPVFAGRGKNMDGTAVWTGYLRAGDTITLQNYVENSAYVSNASNRLHISGVA